MDGTYWKPRRIYKDNIKILNVEISLGAWGSVVVKALRY